MAGDLHFRVMVEQGCTDLLCQVDEAGSSLLEVFNSVDFVSQSDTVAGHLAVETSSSGQWA